MSTPVPDFPTRGETADQLKQLIDGVIDRGKASAWAVSWLMRSDEFRVAQVGFQGDEALGRRIR
jgi:hypothetical protein